MGVTISFQGDVLAFFDAADVLNRDAETLGEVFPGDPAGLSKFAELLGDAGDKCVGVFSHSTG
jgi:hypothetical protein